jgi:hypothetical protein
MTMLLWSFAGSMLAYFAFLSASSSAASAQVAGAQNWPPSQAQQQALQVQISQLIREVTGKALTPLQQLHLTDILAAAPTEYTATLPQGAPPTFAGYQAWVLSGTAGQAAAQAQPGSSPTPTAGGPIGLQGGYGIPSWDVHGNAYFVGPNGQVYVVYQSADSRGDWTRGYDVGPNWTPPSRFDGWSE